MASAHESTEPQEPPGAPLRWMKRGQVLDGPAEATPSVGNQDEEMADVAPEDGGESVEDQQIENEEEDDVPGEWS